MPKYRPTTWGATAYKMTCPITAVGRTYISNAAPSASELNEIAASELAAGYSPDTVGLNATIRQTAKDLWISPHGVSLGPVPDGRLLANNPRALYFAYRGGLYDYLSDFSSLKWPLGWLATWNSFPAMVATMTPAPIYGMRNPHMNLADIKDYAEYFLGMPLPGGTPVEVVALTTGTAISAPSSAVPRDLMWSLIDNDSLVISVLVPGNYANDTAHGSGWYAYKVPSPAGMEGLRYLSYAPIYSTSWITAAPSARDTYPRLHAFAGDAFWHRILSRLIPYSTWTSVAYTNVGLIPYSWGYGNTRMTYAIAPGSDSTKLISLPSAVAADNGGTGCSVHTAYTIGGPEWAYASHLVGDVVVDNAAKTIQVAAGGIGIEWQGSKIAAIAANYSEVDQTQRDAIGTLLIRSFISATQRTVPQNVLALTDIAMKAQEAGVDLTNEILIPATIDAPAVTFGEANERASGMDATLVHAVYQAGLGSQIYDRIELAGTIAVPAVTGWSGITATYDPASEEVVSSIMSGALVSCTIAGETPATASAKLFGVTPGEFTAGPLMVTVGNEFNETYLFPVTCPDTALLGDMSKAAFYLVQYARPRKALSSFIIGSLVQAKVATKGMP